jgi:AmiR, N-terminal
MNRPSPFSVRGRRALMVMRDERETSIVRRQLSRLGMTISEHDPAAPPPNQAVDVILMDADAIPIKSDQAMAWKGNVPIIALIGTETPSRLKWLLDLRPASFLIKPLRSAGLYTALWLRSIQLNEGSTKPRTSKNWRTASGPAGSCSPPSCRSCAVTICRRPTRLRSFDRPRCAIAPRSRSCARKSSRPAECRTGRRGRRSDRPDASQIDGERRGASELDAHPNIVDDLLG